MNHQHYGTHTLILNLGPDYTFQEKDFLLIACLNKNIQFIWETGKWVFCLTSKTNQTAAEHTNLIFIMNSIATLVKFLYLCEKVLDLSNLRKKDIL